MGGLRSRKSARKEAGFQLGKVHAGLDPEDWTPFDEVGAGTREIRIRDEGGAFRVMYVAKFAEANASDIEARQRNRRGPLSRSDARAIGREMKIDTEIRDVTKPGATGGEAKRLHAASRKHINYTRALKRQLMEELSFWIASHKLKQADAAEILMVSRPRVSPVVNKKIGSVL